MSMLDIKVKHNPIICIMNPATTSLKYFFEDSSFFLFASLNFPKDLSIDSFKKLICDSESYESIHKFD